jgi:hypothetical protein
MSRRSTFLAVALFLLPFIACKKNNAGGPPAALAGNWSFVSVAAHTQSTETDISGIDTFKEIITYQYTSTNNMGVINFSADSMYEKGLGYSIAPETEAYDYNNGILKDSVSLPPLSFTLPTTNTATNYQLVGTDSIYYPDGGILSMSGTAGTSPAGAAGGHYVISGGTMTITISINDSTTQSGVGFTGKRVVQGPEVVTLKKQ